jgi:ABC-type Fe3+ transport system permease subunit
MSAITAPTGTRAPTPAPAGEAPKAGMSKVKKVLLGLGAFYLLGLIFFIAVFGFKPHKSLQVLHNTFTPTDEFKLSTWFSAGPIDFNKGVLYVLLAAVITLLLLFYVARRLRQRPGRLQAAIEMYYSLTESMTNDSLHDNKLQKKYFPLVLHPATDRHA